ncbi:hypothetical protein KAR10_06380, partial [bacterium]|nr:hypothetical protein [bacterium]
MRKNKILTAFLLLGVLLCCFHTAAQAGTSEAGNYLESAQNFDGSWGHDPATIFFETTEALNALHSLERTGDAYQRGVNFIANYEIGGVE